MAVEAVKEIVVAARLAPDGDGHEVAILLALEGRVHGDELGAEGGQVPGIVALPPLALDEVAPLHPGRALVERRPGSGAALGIVEIRPAKVLEPLFVLAQLRAEGLAGGSPQGVARLGLHGQAQERHVDLVAQDPPGQVVLVPGGHDDDDLGACGKACFQAILPLLPDAVADGGGVGLLPGLHRVVHDQKLRRVSRDAREKPPGDHPPPVAMEFKLPGAADLSNGNAEHILPQRQEFFPVAAAEAFGKFVGVSGHDDPPVRPAA